MHSPSKAHTHTNTHTPILICRWDLSVPSGCLCRAVTHAASWSTRRPGLTWIKLRGCPFQICRGPQRHIRPQRELVKKKERGERVVEIEREGERERGKRLEKGGGKEAHEMGWRKRRALELKGGREDEIVCACMWQSLTEKNQKTKTRGDETEGSHTYIISRLYSVQCLIRWP